MRLAKVRSVALIGVRGTVIDIEVHIGGMPGFTLVGLPDTSLYESRDRVRAAVLSSCEPWPLQKITASLSPAALPKRGSHFDLGLAVAILMADGAIPQSGNENRVFVGELGLDGRLRPVPGVLPAVVAAARAGFGEFIVPEANAGEAALVPGVHVLGARSLRQIVAFLRDEPMPDEPEEAVAEGSGRESPLVPMSRLRPDLDLAEVAGQAEAKFAVQVAAAGHHHIALNGPPGAGKTMLAQRLPGLLPDLVADDALEVTAIHSVAGTLPREQPLISRPPFADPHHTSSPVAIVGGGSGTIRPGAASLAHLGVLFLDEAPEFQPRVLDSLRQPLEDGEIVITRSAATVVFPARFLLALARNPCPCGFYDVVGHSCECKPDTVRRYRQRISGPVRDRIDVRIDVLPPSMADLDKLDNATSSKVVADEVAEARQQQAWRLRDTPWRTNGEVPGPYLRKHLPVPADVAAPAIRELRRGAISLRGVDRVLRLAWTIADLDQRERPTAADVERAIGLRMTARG
jgi:magnesium chelatase family protein